MQGGVVLGVIGILSLVVFRWSFVVPFLSTLFGVMLLATPVLATFLTLRYRNLNYGEREPFSFVHGFLYAVFTGFYASVWVAMCICSSLTTDVFLPIMLTLSIHLR